MSRLTNITILLVFMFSINIYGEHKELTINDRRVDLQLNFETTYITYIQLDIELMIQLPHGYSFTAAIPGSKDFIKAYPVQNTMYVTKISEGSFSTNLAMHVVTPEGIEKKLIFKFIARRSEVPEVMAIHFHEKESSELNRTVAEIKEKYLKQMNRALTDNEKALDTLLHKQIMTEGQPWFYNSRPHRRNVKYKGVDVKFYGMYNSRADSYIYINANVKNTECKIVQLVKAGLKDALMPAEYVGMIKSADNETYNYIYRIPQIQIKKKRGKRRKQKLYLKYQIWSKKLDKRYRIY